MQFSYNQGEAENIYSQKEFVELFRGKTKEKVVEELIRNGSRERDTRLLVDRMVFYSEYFKKTADGRKQLSYMFKEKAKDYGYTVLSGFGR
jgi:C-terminal processing protease CtpA/Prc